MVCLAGTLTRALNIRISLEISLGTLYFYRMKFLYLRAQKCRLDMIGPSRINKNKPSKIPKSWKLQDILNI